jgi:hypothetical protein
MLQIRERIIGVDSSNRLQMEPDDPDYSWKAKVFEDPRLRILKVCVVQIGLVRTLSKYTVAL